MHSAGVQQRGGESCPPRQCGQARLLVNKQVRTGARRRELEVFDLGEHEEREE